MAPVLVVPALETTMNGLRPAARSPWIAAAISSTRTAKLPSTGTLRTLRAGKPATVAALHRVPVTLHGLEGELWLPAEQRRGEPQVVFADDGLEVERRALSELLPDLYYLIGFTAEPHALHSGRFASDVCKRQPIPILHVNGEDPDAVVRAARLAIDYRFEFSSDVVVDLIGSFRINEYVELYARAENLFDEDYEDVLGFNTPGVSGFGGIRLRFR